MKKRFFSMVLMILSLGMMTYAETSDENAYHGMPVEVIGVPYSYADIRGSHTLDYPIEYMYEKIARNAFFTSFSPLNFRVNKFVYEFKKDGSLIFHTNYSYDKTPSDNGGFYSAKDEADSTWNLTPAYHSHTERCSLDRYDDMAIAQGKLNEARKDAALNKIYDILLSVATNMDYNYPAIGRQAKFVTPMPLVGVCDDYTALLITRLTDANIDGVSDVVKVTGQNHAWVTLQYKGQLLYLDATWFDKNVIDETGTVVHTPYKDPRNMTFDNDVFTNHGMHHLSSLL